MAVRRLILLGFMAAGKSTLAPKIAHALGWRVFDVDSEIVRERGRPVSEIFRLDGESWFRQRESELTAALCSEENVVIAPGGGWIASPGSETLLKAPGTRSIWLRLTAEESVRRARQDGGTRPLLEGDDALDIAGRLLAEREPRYASADLVVDVDGRSADDVLDDILTWLKTSIS